MASVWLKFLVFLYTCVLFVKAEECVVYDFENDTDSLFKNDRGICAAVPSSWTAGYYSQSGVASPNVNSSSFIYPSSTLSCTSSFDFTMSVGGVVEVNVYMDDASVTNYITVLVFESTSTGNDPVVATNLVTPSDPSYTNGWQTLRTSIQVSSNGNFQGYISILGIASADSTVLIDSIRYIPPKLDGNSCVIYEEDRIDTTTESQETTTQRTDGIEDCVTYNFETDFEIRFTTDNYLCDGFLPWHLDNYTSIDIERPNPQSTAFMAPSTVSSCISSFKFKMTPDGIIEANIFMDAVTVLDHIIILAQKFTGKDYDTVAGFQMYYPEDQVFVSGWNVLRFNLQDLASFEGYLVFIGRADAGSTVLIDSVRYIPPSTPPEDASCALY